jgi:peptidoglycan/LPS O-acetylase OafA/YrhL
MLYISNFVLDIHNLKLYIMKRAVILFVIIAMVLVSSALWLMNVDTAFKPYDFLTVAITIIIVGFAVFVLYRRAASTQQGEPAEDELSKKVLQKTAALSYYISLYLWVAMIFIKDRVSLDTEELIGAGILGMALSFAICWVILNFRGIRNE